MRKLLLLLLLLACSQIWAAATTTRSSYIVEVLVIQHVDADDNGEIWISDNVEKDKTDKKDEKDTKDTGATASDLSKAVIVTGTPPANSRLSKVADSIKEDKNYRILAHKRWFQYAEPKSNAKFIRINGAENTEPVLDGTLLFYSTRYLHVVTDLSLKEKLVPETAEEGSEETTPVPVMRINERRRIRVRQINYFDHPRFGLLVYVEPAKR